MRPKEKVKTHAQGLLEDRRLDLMLRMEHELVRLSEAIDWASLAESFGPLYSEKTGRPSSLIASLLGFIAASPAPMAASTIPQSMSLASPERLVGPLTVTLWVFLPTYDQPWPDMPEPSSTA